MRLLALDAATEACTVALWTDAGLISRRAAVGAGQSEQILGMVDALLRESGVGLGMLDGIAASVGPGAFTGVRISVSVAQGLAFGAGIPVVPVSTLEALALQAVRGGAVDVLACLDARLGEVYWGCFSAHPLLGVLPHGALAVGLPAHVSVPFTGDFHGIGRGFAAYPALGERLGATLRSVAATALPDAEDMARLAVLRLAGGGGCDPADLTPLYLRDRVAFTEVERAAAKAATP